MHMKGVLTAQRLLLSHCAVVHGAAVQVKRELVHLEASQHAVHILVLFHASGVAAQPPAERPAEQ